MASNNWAPLPPRKNDSKKKNKGYENKICNELKEMFGSNFDSDIIMSVAQSCNWQLEPSIEALIRLADESSNSTKPKAAYDPWVDEELPWESSQNNLMGYKAADVLQQEEMLREFEQAKLKAMDLNKSNAAYQNECDNQNLLDFSQDNSAASNETLDKSNESGQKMETASLCGLKVQYRPKGMENQSDDDADVVIEEEVDEEETAKRVTFEPPRINVCQFLSSPLRQCPPKNTIPKVNYVSTPSPPRSPRRPPPSEKPTVLSRIYQDIDKGYKILILMRGLPGSGKSYLARSIIERTPGATINNHIFGADDYFSRRGTYHYDQNSLSDAHAYCQKRAAEAMRKGVSPVIIDNTNTQVWEMQPFAFVGVENGYIIETLEPSTPWCWNARDLEKRNTHAVPKIKILKMIERYEKNISGDRLLRISRFDYKPNNRPPQMRSYPPLPTQTTPIRNEPLPTATSSPRRRMRKPRKNVEADKVTWPDTMTKDNANVNLDDSEMKLRNESWTEGTSYKNDSLLDMSKLGAIGCERKVTTKNDDSFEDAQLIDVGDKPEIDEKQAAADAAASEDRERSAAKEAKNVLDEATKFGMMHAVPMHMAKQPSGIGVSVHVDVKTHVEFGNSLPAAIEDQNKKTPESSVEDTNVEDPEIDEDPSECRDFYMIVGKNKIMSNRKQKRPKKPVKLVWANDGKSSLIHVIPLDKLLANKTPEGEASNQISESKTAAPDSDIVSEVIEPIIKTNEPKENDSTEVVIKESSTPSDKEGSESSSFEKISDVDMMQFEVYEPDPIVDSQRVPVDETCENKESQNIGGLDYIFNFFKTSYSEKNNDKKIAGDEDNTDIDIPDNLENSSSSMNDSGMTSPLIPDIVNVTSEDQQNSNLQVQETDLSLESDITEIVSEVEKREADNVVEQLLDASSDFQLVEQSDYIVRRTVTEEREETVDNDEQEKSAAKQMKNFKNFETENKVSKESINTILGGGRQKVTETVRNSPKSRRSPKFLTDNDINTENFNLITWRESPFPIDKSESPIFEENTVKEEKPETKDCSTYTDPYDFNVVFMGGVDGYNVIKAVNRNINDPSLMSPNNNQHKHRSHKLMLDKGTMTISTSVFSTATMLDLEDTHNSDDRSAEIIELFPNVPVNLILEIYRSLCMYDFNWAVDYINHLKAGDISSYKRLHSASDTQAAVDKFPNIKPVQEHQRKNSSDSSSSSGNINESTPKNQRQKPAHSKKKSKIVQSDEKLALKLELENKIVISEDSYSQHTLRVKRWKNREFDKPYYEQETDENFTLEEEFGRWIGVVPTESIERNVAMLNPPSLSDEPKHNEESSEEGDDEEEDEDQDEREVESNDEETIELKLGDEFIRELEKNFGSADFESSDGLMPVIQIPKSIAQQLHAYWIESMNRQFWTMQEHLDMMIAKDAEYARSLEAEEMRAMSTPEVPNLKEIMDMEMALATYTNDIKRNQRKELPKEIAKRVTQETLYSMYPDFDRKMLSEIYEAHERDFDETVKVIEDNCANKSTLTMADVLKKRKNLIDELKKESYFRTSLYNQLDPSNSRDEASGGDYYYDDEDEDLMSYEKAMATAESSREEARRQFALRTENYCKAQEAYRKKNPEVAAYYSDMAKLHMKSMERANESAASAYLAAQMQASDANNTLDLHFLHVSEAIEALNIFIDHQLDQMSIGMRKRILIITGKGTRSAGRQSKLKPAVARELNRRSIRFEEVKCNSGMLQAFLRKK